jgi:ribosomal protein S18 acetylase RimI-like enzyme
MMNPLTMPLPHQRGCWASSSRSGEPVIESLGLQLLASADWQTLRAARLKALLDSPHAFMSSYGQESEWGESEWLQLFDTATWIVAHEANTVIGLARSVGEPKRPAARHLESIWVAPTHRQRGVCRALLYALAEADRSMGVTDLLLWVLEDNHDARRAYHALGFVPTGERQPLPASERFEQRLMLCIRKPAVLMSGDTTSNENILAQVSRPAPVSNHEVVRV